MVEPGIRALWPRSRLPRRPRGDCGGNDCVRVGVPLRPYPRPRPGSAAGLAEHSLLSRWPWCEYDALRVSVSAPRPAPLLSCPRLLPWSAGQGISGPPREACSPPMLFGG
jgi:hypothetical protein